MNSDSPDPSNRMTVEKIYKIVSSQLKTGISEITILESLKNPGFLRIMPN